MRNQQKTRLDALKAQEEAEKERRRDLITQRSQAYNLDFLQALNQVLHQTDWKTPEEWESKYGRWTNPEENAKWIYIMKSYDFVGLQLEQGIELEFLFDLHPAHSVIALWETFEPIVQWLRDNSNAPRHFGYFESLYKEARKLLPDMTPLRLREQFLPSNQ
jgi:hypothetical protein